MNPIRPTKVGEKKQLIEFIETEKELRREFDYLEAKLIALLSQIKKHNRAFYNFYEKSYGNARLIVIGKENNPNKCFVVQRPSMGEPTVSNFMPTSVVFSEETIIKDERRGETEEG